MTIDSPLDNDWSVFLRWAAEEGWRVPARELELFRGPFAESAFVLRGEAGPRGFVTAVRHDRSGWIGNLIVDPDRRGQGVGARLFEHAVQDLERRGAVSLWLTASTMGRPIYEKRGFRPVDGIVRWVRPAAGAEKGSGAPAPPAPLFRADALAWRESRRGLLDLLAAGGNVFTCGATAVLLQGGEGMQVLGPWLSPECCPRENRQVLGAILEAAAPGAETVADILESSPVQVLLAAAGFERRGSCDLMVRGPLEADFASIVALASLGSMG